MSELNVKKKISWKQGLSIALGVPLLIMPSIAYFTSYFWSFSILIWILSVGQGFLQNLAYAEMAIDFPDATGLPGYAQKVLSERFGEKGRFVGGLCAWGYWFAWSPILAIFTLSISDFLYQSVGGFQNTPVLVFRLVIAIILYVLLFIFNYRGIESSALVGYILNAVSLLPLVVIAIAPFFNHLAKVGRVLPMTLPRYVGFDFKTILIILGVFGMAQWSACAWETAALYAPDYESPKRDVIRALFGCGAICLIIFALVQTSCIATLGLEGVITASKHPMIQLAELSFGKLGGLIAGIMIVCAMIMVMQTGFVGASTAMHSTAKAGNLPNFFRGLNKYGMPIHAMATIIVLNLGLILMKNQSTIIAASSIGYTLANGISLFAYYLHKKNKQVNEESLSVPRKWWFVGIVFAFVNVPLFLVGLIYLNVYEGSYLSTVIGLLVIGSYYFLYKWARASTMACSQEHIADFQ